MSRRRAKRRHYMRFYALYSTAHLHTVNEALLPYEKTYPGWNTKSWRLP